MWVHLHDRLGRDEIDLLGVGRMFRAIDVHIRSLTEGELDETMFGMQAILAGHGRREFLRRSRAGIEEAVKAGRFIEGVVPFGFRVEGRRPHGRLVPDDADEIVPGLTAADVVRRVYERIALDDWSCWKVAMELNALEVPTQYRRTDRAMAKRPTSGRWSEGRVRNMVGLPVHRGEMTYGRHSKKRDRKVLTARIEGIVSDELFEGALAAFARHRIAAKNTERRYLLSGLMTCAHCGTRLVGSMNRGEVWYRCSGSRRFRGRMDGRCFGRDIKGALIEPMVRQDVERFLARPGDILDELRVDAVADDDAARPEAARTAIVSGMGRLERELVTYRRMVGNESMTEDDYLVERDRIGPERRLLEERLAALEPAGRPVAPVEAEVADVLRERLAAGLTDREWQEVMRHLVAGIEITTILNEHGPKDAKARIRYRFDAAVSTRTGTRAAGTANPLTRAVPS